MSSTGRVAVVTGAAQGIGRDYARTLSRCGHRVVVADLNIDAAKETAALIDSEGGIAAAMYVDVSDQASTQALAGEIEQVFDTVDVLVNNAAIYHSMRMDSQLTVDIDYWRRVFAVNLDGALLMTQAMAPFMIEKQWGRIVNQASTAAYKAIGGHYGCSKLAMIGLTQGFARELGPYGITVNSIAPGPIFTEATSATISSEKLDSMIASACIPRKVGPEEVCGALEFFVSDAASWITAQTLIIDGGIVARL